MEESTGAKVRDIRADVVSALKIWDASQADGMQFILQQRGNWEAERARLLRDICEEVGISMIDLIWNEAESLAILHGAVMSSNNHSQTEKLFMLESISCDFSSLDTLALSNRH